jgi:hypothetical protein
LTDKDETMWMVDVQARRAQRLAAPYVGGVRYDGRNLVVRLEDGSFAAASMG